MLGPVGACLVGPVTTRMGTARGLFTWSFAVLTHRAGTAGAAGVAAAIHLHGRATGPASVEALLIVPPVTAAHGGREVVAAPTAGESVSAARTLTGGAAVPAEAVMAAAFAPAFPPTFAPAFTPVFPPTFAAAAASITAVAPVGDHVLELFDLGLEMIQTAGQSLGGDGAFAFVLAAPAASPVSLVPAAPLLAIILPKLSSTLRAIGPPLAATTFTIVITIVLHAASAGAGTVFIGGGAAGVGTVAAHGGAEAGGGVVAGATVRGRCVIITSIGSACGLRRQSRRTDGQAQHGTTQELSQIHCSSPVVSPGSI